MRNYIKVTTSNGSGLDTLGLFFFDNDDTISRIDANDKAEACVHEHNKRQPKYDDGRPKRPARMSCWHRIPNRGDIQQIGVTE